MTLKTWKWVAAILAGGIGFAAGAFIASTVVNLIERWIDLHLAVAGLVQLVGAIWGCQALAREMLNCFD